MLNNILQPLQLVVVLIAALLTGGPGLLLQAGRAAKEGVTGVKSSTERSHDCEQERLVDELIDAYVSWREACFRVSEAYDTWTRETGINSASAFAWYMDALDREESASEVYAGLVRRTSQVVANEHSAVAQTARR